MILNSPYISGSLTVTGNIISSGSITISGSIASASYASNAERVDGLDSTSFVFTSSYNTDSASVSTRVTKIEGNYATTGSNVFMGAQTVCANITSTGTIIAQTLNVQQVTSSIVYSSGSNVFGCSLTNTQQFTGSVTMTGSLTVTTAGTSPEFQVNSGGTIKGNALTDVHQVTGSLRITGSGNHFIVGGNVGIGASSPSSILELCAATPIMTLNQTTGNSNQGINFNSGATTYGKITNNAATGIMTIQNGNATGDGYLIRFITDGNERLRLGTTGIACFACRVCAPSLTVSNTNAVLTIQGTATPGEAQVDLEGKNSGGTVRSATFKYDNSDIIRLGTSSNITMRFETNDTTRLCIMNTGIAVFACQVCATSTSFPLDLTGNTNNYGIRLTSAQAATLFLYSTFNNAGNRNWGLYTNSNVFGDFDIRQSNCKDGDMTAGANGTSRFYIKNDGNVGINTVSPNNTSANRTVLDLNGTSTSLFNLSINGTRSGYLYHNGTNVEIGNEASGGAIEFNTAGSTRMRITSTGIACFACQVCAPSIITNSLRLNCSTGLHQIFAARCFTVNTTTYADTGIGQAGLLVINTSNDRAGVFVISAPGAGNSAIVEIGDPSSIYSTTCNNANTFNLFFSGGSGNLLLQNCSGATRDFSLTLIGTP